MCFKKGKVLIISAPSGSGKTTITKFLISQNFNLVFSISACTRKKRKNELDGVDYYFLNINEFKKKIKNGDFLEWEEVYDNSFYGTFKKDVEEKLNSGKNIIFDIDIQGALSLKNYFKKDSFSIYIDAPFNIIEKRLRDRKTESEQDIFKRLAKIKEEGGHKNKFDVIINNVDLKQSKKEIKAMVTEFLKIQ